MDYLKFVSTRLRTLREGAGYSLEKLARTASKNGIIVTKDLIHNIEKSRVNSFDPNVMAAIAAVFNLSLSDFLKVPDGIDLQNIDSAQLGKLVSALKNVPNNHAKIAVDTAINLLNSLSTKNESKNKSKIKLISKDNYNGDLLKLIPCYDLQIAAGYFDEKVTDAEPLGFTVIEGVNNKQQDYFISKITGTSMEPLIPDASFCLFKKYSGGSRQNKIMLVRARGVIDPENGAAYLVKRYKRVSNINDDHQNRADIEIHLVSENKKFSPIILKQINDDDISTPCEFVCCL